MARTPALFNGPIEFTDANGSQVSLPLSEVYFDDKGQIQAQGPAVSNLVKDKSVLNSWLQYLVGAGLLVPGQNPRSVPALVITAASPGAFGNFIQVTIANPITTDSANPKFDMTVLATETYTGLTTDSTNTQNFIQNVLGKTAGGGTQPGLVFVASMGTDVPAVTKSDIPLTITSPNPAVAAVPGASPGSTAFTVQAKTNDPDGAHTSIAIQNVSGSAFTLVAKWSKTLTQITAAGIGVNFVYVLNVAGPGGATPSLPPAPGTYVLSGGSDAVSLAAATASAILTTG